MPDLDDLMGSIGEFYPGSKMKRRSVVAPETPKKVPDEFSWDAKPVMKTLHGKQVEMFTIGALAKALGKAEGTIRSYQDKGYLPITPYRLPTRMVNGSPRAGRRLFTRAMVEAAIESFAKRNLLDTKRVEWRDHRDLSAEIATEWKRIQDEISS